MFIYSIVLDTKREQTVPFFPFTWDIPSPHLKGAWLRHCYLEVTLVEIGSGEMEGTLINQHSTWVNLQPQKRNSTPNGGWMKYRLNPNIYVTPNISSETLPKAPVRGVALGPATHGPGLKRCASMALEAEALRCVAQRFGALKSKSCFPAFLFTFCDFDSDFGIVCVYYT